MGRIILGSGIITTGGIIGARTGRGAITADAVGKSEVAPSVSGWSIGVLVRQGQPLAGRMPCQTTARVTGQYYCIASYRVARARRGR